MCRFCWHRIKDLDGKCPHCRKPYDPSSYTFTPPDPEEYLFILWKQKAKQKKKFFFSRLERMKKEKKQKEKTKKGQTNSRKHLTNVRVIQVCQKKKIGTTFQSDSITC